MSIPVAVEKVFAEVLSGHFADVHRAASFGDLGATLERRLKPIVCVCEESESPKRNGVQAWNAAVSIDVWSLRDLPIDAADAYADGVFAWLSDHTAEIQTAAAAIGWQFGNIREAAQGLRVEESARAISQKYELVATRI